MGKYFGTDGFRGEANKTLTVEHAYKVGRYLGYYFGKKHEDGKAHIVIGKDTRLSSYMFEYSLAAGLAASGADAYLLHVTTTPSVAYVTRVDELDCGIMISASHNPFYDNGIKLINGDGEKMSEELILEIEDYIDGKIPEIPFAVGDKIGKTVDHVNARNRYMGYLMGLAKHSYRGVKVGLDPGNGSAWSLAKSIFDALGAETHVIHAEPDGTNINKGCGSTHIEDLQEFVKEKNLDIGFAFDGDADRCLAVDEQGNVLTGDHILYIYARYMKERDKLMGNTVVTTVMSNMGLYKALSRLDINFEKTDVGDKNVYACMSRNGYTLGGEQSGHIIFAKYATTGDGIITAIKVMEAMLARKKKISELVKELKIFPQVLKNVRVDDKDKAMSDPGLTQLVSRVTDELGDDGRVLVRKSGTEPVVRVMIEADTEEKCHEKADILIDYLEKNHG